MIHFSPNRPIYICGPTASGKSALAISIANKLDGEIVNADAYQLYRGMEIISATPSPEELTQAPLIRALEICLLSGQKMSDLKNTWKKDNAEVEKSLQGIYLAWEPETLRKRISLRTEIMLSEGAIEESSNASEITQSISIK